MYEQRRRSAVLGGARRAGVAHATYAAALLLTGAACSTDGGPFIMMQMRAVVDSDAALADYFCTRLGAGSGSSGGGGDGDDFWTRMDSSSDGISVRVGSFGEVLEQRFYGRAFATSHGLDHFSIETQRGAGYAFVFWGGDECQRCPPGPSEPQPGDPWGCNAGDAGAATP